MDSLVDDQEISGVPKEYMSKEHVRTFIKADVLSSYTKTKNKLVLESVHPEDIVKWLYTFLIQQLSFHS